jgi:hypothetical protein
MTTPLHLNSETDPSIEELVPQPDEQDVVDVDQSSEVLITTFNITSFGADYPVDGLIKRLNAGDVSIPSFDPNDGEADGIGAFQRKFVWGRPQMDRFIESLLLGLPVPGIFLIRDKTNKLFVLDGQQRLRTLQFFYSGIFLEKRYKLSYVQKPYENMGYEDLPQEDRRRLDDSIIHATVLLQDSDTDSQEAVYSIFERLNTGGSPLQPQEIRVALYPGPFLKGISDLNSNEAWRALYGKISPRLKDHEMILRVLAMYEKGHDYSRPLKGFMNTYLRTNRFRELNSSESIGATFVSAMKTLEEHVGAKTFRPLGAVNAAVVDSISVGMMRRVARGPVTDGQALRSAYNDLVKDPSFTDAIGISTSKEETVFRRISAAESAFSSVR